MLNIIKLNLLNSNAIRHTLNEVKTPKHFPSSVREWKNSIYVYNENNLNLIPITTMSGIKLIKSYFLLYNKKIEKKIRTERLLLRYRRLSSNKIYISNGEFKHTNNKIIINLYLFNRQKYNYMLAIKKLYLRAIFGKNNKKKIKFETNKKLKKFPIKKVKSKHKNINRFNIYISRNIGLYKLRIGKYKHKNFKFGILNTINPTLNRNNITKLINCKFLEFNETIIIKYDNYKLFKVNNSEIVKVKNFNFFKFNKLSNMKSKLILLDKLIITNFSKYNSKGKKLIKITKKNQLINKEKIFAQPNKFNKLLAYRIKVINKRGIYLLKLINKEKYLVLKLLKKGINKKISLYITAYVTNFYKKFVKRSLRKLQLYFYYKQLLYINKSKSNYNYLQYLTTILYSIYNKNIEYNLINLKRFYLHSDILAESITLKLTKNRKRMLKKLDTIKKKVKIKNSKNSLSKKTSSKKLDYKKNSTMLINYLRKNIINSLKYKGIAGFRLEAKGRLTRRYTASRSVLKIKYKGNLLDLSSRHKGLSTILLKGNLKSNLQYTKLKSKSRIGSFGIKGWVSGN